MHGQPHIRKKKLLREFLCWLGLVCQFDVYIALVLINFGDPGEKELDKDRRSQSCETLCTYVQRASQSLCDTHPNKTRNFEDKERGYTELLVLLNGNHNL